MSGRRNARPVPVRVSMTDTGLAWMEIYKSVPCRTYNFSKYTGLLSDTTAPATVFAEPLWLPPLSQKIHNRYFIAPYNGVAGLKGYIYG
jgi:hypothetical protein